MAEKIINNTEMKASCDPIIIYPNVLKMCPEGNNERLYVCDQYLISFGTRKKDYWIL